MARWDELLARIPPATAEARGAEVGVWEGAMSEALLKRHGRLFLYLVDRWAPPPPGDSFRGSGSLIAEMPAARHKQAFLLASQRLARFSARTACLKGASDAMAAHVPDRSLDFVFIDADHSYAGCRRDIMAWLPKVRPGGVIGGHDYNRPDKGDVTRAVQECFPGTFEAGPHNCWWVRVPPPA